MMPGALVDRCAGRRVAETTGEPAVPVVDWQCDGPDRHDPSCRELSPDRVALRPSVLILARFAADVNSIGHRTCDTAPDRSVLLEEGDQFFQAIPNTVLDHVPLGEDIEKR